MKVLVIGGAGYIGSHVVRYLLDKNMTVMVFDNLSNGTKENLFDNVEFMFGDICNYHEIETAMAQDIDALVHLAALKAPGESMKIPEKYSVNNISGTINILNAACKHHVNNFIFSSSAAIYGEPQYIPVDEEHPVTPINYYGFTKLEIERLLKWYDKLKDIKYASLRYFNAVGYDLDGRITGIEKNSQNLLPKIMDVAIGRQSKLVVYGDDYDTRDGTCIRDYIHVTDLAKAHYLALKHISDNKRSLTVNLGSEKGLSVTEIVQKSRKITKQPIPTTIGKRRAGDPVILIASSKKAKKVLGWKPVYSDAETIIKSTWNVYKELL